MRVLVVAIGSTMIVVTAALSPGWAHPAAVPGLAAVLLSLPARTRSAAAVTAASVAALLTAGGQPIVPAALGAGLLVLAYLLLVDVIDAPARGRVVSGIVAGLAGGGIVAVALLVPAMRGVFGVVFAVAGLAALLAAYVLAVPARARGRPGTGDPTAVDR